MKSGGLFPGKALGIPQAGDYGIVRVAIISDLGSQLTALLRGANVRRNADDLVPKIGDCDRDIFVGVRAEVIADGNRMSRVRKRRHSAGEPGNGLH